MQCSTSEVRTQYAERRWGCGRLPQLAVRVWHELTAHDWSPWNVEAPEDELGRKLSPEPDTMVFCFRACMGMCGAVQSMTIRFDQFTELSNVRDH